jgi:integrase
VRERGLHGNPARPLAAPKKRDVPTETFPPSIVERIIGAQSYPADTVGTTLILRYGLRRGGIVNARRRDFDFERQLLTVHTKGGRIYPLPLPDAALWLALGRLDLENPVARRALAPLPPGHAAAARRHRGRRRTPDHQRRTGWIRERHPSAPRPPADGKARSPLVVSLP